jgi:hypothetical protein
VDEQGGNSKLLVRALVKRTLGKRILAKTKRNKIPSPRSTNDRCRRPRVAGYGHDAMKEKKTMMKMILMGALVTAALVSSAMAQSYQPEWGSGNIVPNTSYAPTPPAVSGPYAGSGRYVGAPRAFAPESRAYGRDSYASAPRHHLRFHDMQGHSDMDRE